MDNDQLKGEIVLSDILEVSCSAFTTAAAAESKTNTEESKSTRSFFGFSKNSTPVPIPDSEKNKVNSLLIHEDDSEGMSRGTMKSAASNQSIADKGFFIRTSTRVYIFQAETIGEAANWVVALRTLIGAVHM